MGKLCCTGVKTQETDTDTQDEKEEPTKGAEIVSIQRGPFQSPRVVQLDDQKWTNSNPSKASEEDPWKDRMPFQSVVSLKLNSESPEQKTNSK